MKALLVIDVQDIYLKRYKDLSFIENINRKIEIAEQDNGCIIYIKNVGPFRSNGPEYKFCDSILAFFDELERLPELSHEELVELSEMVKNYKW